MQLYYGKAEEAGMCSKRIQRLEQLTKKWVDDGVTPALAYIVVREGIVVSHKAYGMEKDTLFPAMSISKPVTATATMLLVEEGLLSLNRPVAKYIPEYIGKDKERVEVQHLLTHSSGIRDEISEHTDIEKTNITSHQHPAIHGDFCLGLSTPLYSAPGEQLAYSNYGYVLLGEIICRISKDPFHDFINKQIFAPLSLTDSYFMIPDDKLQQIVKRPPTARRAAWFAEDAHKKVPHPAGNLHTTVKDMAILGQMFLCNGKYGDICLLSPASVATMTRSHKEGLCYKQGVFSPSNWGLGWSIYSNTKDTGSLCSTRTFYHYGSGGATLLVDPENKLVEVFFMVEMTPKGSDYMVDYFTNTVISCIVV